MSQENIEILRRGLEAFNSEDLGRILAFIHPEFEGEVPPEFSAEPDTYSGREGIRRYFDSFRDAMDEIRFHPERFWDAGDRVVVTARLSARGKQTEIAVEQRFAQVWSIRDGMAIGVETYATVEEALETVGLRE
jgi:ketosteroid isomerase-like protein